MTFNFVLMAVLSFLVMFCRLSEEDYYGYPFPYAGHPTYVGCYSDFRSAPFPPTTFQDCMRACAKFYTKFFTMKGSVCRLGDYVYNRVPSSNCTETDNFVVYTLVPTHLGCFLDSEDRDLQHDAWMSQGLTSELCIRLCRTKYYRFAATQSSNSCFCWNDYGKHGKAREDQCNMSCPGDVLQTCGGLWRNSVYSVFDLPAFGLLEKDVFHCVFIKDINDECSFYKCKPGWKGNRCQYRDCNYRNGFCGANECTELKVRGELISECICKGGTHSSIYQGC